MLSERDCMRLMARAALRATPEGQVREHMSPSTVTVAPHDDLFAVLSLLQQDDRCVLPVVAGGRLLGIVASGDVLRALDRIRHAREATVIGPIEVLAEHSAAPRG
jgi:Mg/Co/Ni transporter MgtE